MVTLLHGLACFFSKTFPLHWDQKAIRHKCLFLSTVAKTKLSLCFLWAWRLSVLQTNPSCCCDLEYRHSNNVVKGCVCCTSRYESTCSICRGLSHPKVSALTDYEITPYNPSAISLFQTPRVYENTFAGYNVPHATLKAYEYVICPSAT